MTRLNEAIRSGVRARISDNQHYALSVRKHRNMLLRVIRHPVRRRKWRRLSSANGFIDLDRWINGDLSDAQVRRFLKRVVTTRFTARESRLKYIKTKVHRASENFEVYIGRTLWRTGAEETGPKSRWLGSGGHRQQRGHRWATPLVLVPRDEVVDDEADGISIAKILADEGKLCCNNDAVTRGRGTLSDDPWQLIYMTAGN